MSQLIKHFLMDRDTGEWIKGEIRGYVFPKLKNLEVVLGHQVGEAAE